MKIRRYNTGLALAVFVMFASYTARAQKDTLRQEVEVVKAYTPIVLNAEKINEMPVIKDEVHQKPDFSYSIESKPVFSILPVKDLQAATIIGKPAEEPGYGLVRAGVGNYNKPYAELFFNNPTGKNSVFGLHAMHLSSHSKLTLENGDRVDAPFSDNQAEIFMKYMIEKSTLSVNLNINHNGFRYYGYPGSNAIPSFLKTLPQSYTYQGESQTLTKGGININLRNIYASKSDPSIGFDFQYYRSGTKTGQREDFMKFEINLKQPHEGFHLYVDAGFEYSKTSDILFNYIKNDVPLTTDFYNQFWLTFKPAVEIGNETINLKAGFKTWLVFKNPVNIAFKISPDIRFNFAPVKEIINMFAGIDGNYYHNHYSAIAYQNPFIVPTLSVNNHFEKSRVYGGFDGKLSPNTNFKIQVDYSSFVDHPFYYLQGFRLPTTGITPGQAYADNTFRVFYKDLNTLKFNGEITHQVGDKFTLLISANYYKYTTAEHDTAWNLPKFDINFSLSCAITERFTVAADFYVIGKRDGLLVQLNTSRKQNLTWEEIKLFPELYPYSKNTYVMDTAIDLNIRGNYEISRKFSVFAQLNNFGFQKYERWLGYPVQSFNFLGGISFSF